MTASFAGCARVCAVSSSPSHCFSKQARRSVELVAGLGVRGDCHLGQTVQHRSRVRRDPTQPNLRQVHLIASELYAELAAAGYHVAPGQLGENLTTQGLDLLALPAGAVLRVGGSAVVQVTGLRNPCRQIDKFRRGLLAEVLDREPGGHVVRRAGVMGVVVDGGVVRPGDLVTVALPTGPRLPLEPV